LELVKILDMNNYINMHMKHKPVSTNSFLSGKYAWDSQVGAWARTICISVADSPKETRWPHRLNLRYLNQWPTVLQA